MLAAGPVGIMQAVMDNVVPYIHERKQFGQSIGEFQLIQGKVADMYGAAAARAFCYTVGKNLDKLGFEPVRQSARLRVGDPLVRREGDLDGRRGHPDLRRQRLINEYRSAACGATPSCTRSAPALRRCAGC